MSGWHLCCFIKRDLAWLRFLQSNAFVKTFCFVKNFLQGRLGNPELSLFFLHLQLRITDGDDFCVERLVCVDNNEMRPNRRWHRGIPADDVTVTIGSMTVKQLGRLSLASDSTRYLNPISYRCVS